LRVWRWTSTAYGLRKRLIRRPRRSNAKSTQGGASFAPPRLFY
jgi:hypothetical protein